MPAEPRIVRKGRGSFELRIPRAHRALLAHLPQELGEALDMNHPSLRRLFPVAYPDDSERSAEFDSMVRADLIAGKRQALQIVRDTLDSGRLDTEQLSAWVAVLNDLRLFIGTSLDITEQTYDRPVDPRDPDARLMALYSYLSWLQEQGVEALAADLEDVPDR
ncbi:MAG: DUF2017 family protein [Actinomycetota bacterium]